jgi:hypothetical protein
MCLTHLSGCVSEEDETSGKQGMQNEEQSLATFHVGFKSEQMIRDSANIEDSLESFREAIQTTCYSTSTPHQAALALRVASKNTFPKLLQYHSCTLDHRRFPILYLGSTSLDLGCCLGLILFEVLLEEDTELSDFLLKVSTL